MRIVKWVGLGLLALLVLVIVLNWSTIQRLRTVNSLFDADKIVGNFSSMDAAFLHHDLKIGEPQPWEEDLQDLPETVMLAGNETPLSDALTELDTTALVIIRDGKLIHESYYKGTGRDDLRISWSMAKSYMSGLYGQAIEDGLMDISKPIEFYLPQLKGTAYAGASVDDILNMTSGVRFNEDYLDPKSDINDMGRVLGLGGSMDEYTTELKDRQYEPGATWQYVSIDTHVAAMALRKVTGKSLHQLWEETYGANLGMGKAPFYLTDGEDVAFALGGLNLRTRDYAKFGQLFLQNGQWEGEQLIPADWVSASTQNQAPNVHPIRGTGYGYQWWVPMPQEGPSKGDFFAVGIYGQYIYVNPAAGIVIAKNAADREFTVQQSNGQHSMNMNIDMFQSLAEQMRSESDLKNMVDLEGLPIEMRNLELADLSVLNDEKLGSCSFIYNDEFVFFSVGHVGHFKSRNGMETIGENRGQLFKTKLNTKHIKNDLEIWLEKVGPEKGVTSASHIWDGNLKVVKGGRRFSVSGEVECDP